MVTVLVSDQFEGVKLKEGALIFAYAVKNVQDYGSVSLDENNFPIKIENAILETYKKQKFILIKVPKVTIKERVNFILSQL